MHKVELYVDGGCDPNPGVGGWAAILICGNRIKELRGGEPQTTNNRAEIVATIEGLKALKQPCEVTVYSDSQLVIETMKGNFKANKNMDLWQQLFAVADTHTVTWVKIRAHTGDKWNERADELVQIAIAETRRSLGRY